MAEYGLSLLNDLAKAVRVKEKTLYREMFFLLLFFFFLNFCLKTSPNLSGSSDPKIFQKLFV